MGVYIAGNWTIQPHHTLRNAIAKRGNGGLFRTVLDYAAWRFRYWQWLTDIKSSVGYCIYGDICSPPGRLTHGSSEIAVWSKLSDEPWKQTDTNTTKREK